jgi:hypothetical protein
MTYDIKNLNVASLDFDDIRTNLASFLNAQPDLADIDFASSGSAASMLLNILATATTYNGIYAQMAYTNSWPSSSNMVQPLLGCASLSSILIPYIKSASCSMTMNISVGGTGGTGGIDAYTAFNATGIDGSALFFYNIDDIPYGNGNLVNLYSGSQVATFTNYDYATQSIEIPSTIDPDTVSFYVTNNATQAPVKWTRVSKGNNTSSGNQNIFCVIHSANGYRVTNALPNASEITTSYRVSVKGIYSNGSIGNEATITLPSVVTQTYSTVPSGGYDALTLNMAKAKYNFNANGQQRCVTLQDYKNAIVSSGISGTENLANVTVKNSSTPSTVNVYVSGLNSDGQSTLLSYLSNLSVAGISVVYSQ